jgi:HK97 family phage portal protein
VGEGSALALSPVWRAVHLIASTLASLPLRTLREPSPGERERVNSIFDNPGGENGQTAFAWKETLFANLLLHGNCYALKVRNAAGGIVALPVIHPHCVTTRLPTREEINSRNMPVGGQWYRVRLMDGTQKEYDATDIFHVPGLSLDGMNGISVLSYARNSLGTTISADRAAAKKFDNGAMISGMITPEDDLAPGETRKIRKELQDSVVGWENAGGIPVINRKLKFTPWMMNSVDAQFLQSRQFQVEEIARWFGVPPFELMQTEKQTSWGTGIESQQRGLARTVLAPWAARVEQAGSRLLAKPRFIEFDFSGLERPTPQEEIDLLIKQVDAGLLTLNEARAIRNRPPVPGGDAIKALPSADEGGEDNAVSGA